ncbi:tetratricopeptide repeat (TPR)-like superfamily protein [Artemisia annua]|uniref:Tetratricopeptide repeat (TPR)-like superfamily protein n=1 Tax=Artemisia annua TaxID=35608 RepID=A0A2U1LIJ7_ARTAN|nr:tetratricopeptide repeat (TPR)-like superfamily protein [Artemisia annua]
MDGALLSCCFCNIYGTRVSVSFSNSRKTEMMRTSQDNVRLSLMDISGTRVYLRKPIKKNADPHTTNGDSESLNEGRQSFDDTMDVLDDDLENDSNEEEEQIRKIETEAEAEDDPEWDPEEIETISSLFRGRIPQKPGKLGRERPLPLPVPYKNRPMGLPTSKKFARNTNILRKAISSRVYKDPTFLVGLAKEIKKLDPEEDVSIVLDKCSRFLRKGSLSMTVRELGHMGLPERALQIYCWVQEQPHLSPDDRLLASTVEVLARNHELKLSFKLEKFLSLSSKNVYEAVVRGFIRSGNLKLAYKLLSAAKNRKMMLDSGVYAKLILELGKNPDNRVLVLNLLEELGERDDLNLTQQDCTAIMKVCIKLGRFEIVESLYNWFKDSGMEPSVVMYTTLIHSRYSNNCYREALALVWEMEESNCLFDLPAYRVVIKLFVALNDLSRAVRYFSKLKEAGFSPAYDIYMDIIKVYAIHGRIAKCKEVCKEAEAAGFKLEEQTRSLLMELNE